jgi:two-component system C4-dicarboxylate transport sensor histidine kinase DctB
MKIKLSLKLKITLVLMAVSLFFGTVLSYAFYLGMQSEFEKSQIEDMRVLNEHINEELNLMFSHSRDLVSKISKQNEVINYISQSEPEIQKKEIVNILNQYDIGNYFSAIYLMDSEGRTLSSTEESFAGKNYGYRKYFSEALEKGQSVQMAIGATSKESGYYFSSVIDEGQGVAVIKLKSESIQKAFKKKYPEGIAVMLLDQYGIATFSNDTDLKYKSIGWMSREDQKKANIENRFNKSAIQSLNYDKIINWINNSKEKEKIFNYDETEKSSRQTLIIKKTNDFPFYSIVRSDMKEVLSGINKTSLWLASSVLICTILIFLFSYFYLSKALRPLKKLTNTAESIQKGDIERRTDIKTGDEFEELNTALNRMIDKLIKSKENTQKEVEERTDKLKKMNKAMVDRELKMVELKEKIKKLKAKNKDTELE